MDYFEYELNLINYPKKDLILEIIDVIYKQEHSGFSINFIINALKNKIYEYKNKDNSDYCIMLNNDLKSISKYYDLLTNDDIDILVKLLKRKPLSKLTLKDDEWMYFCNNAFQNKRLTSLFKENGVLRYVRAVVFVKENGVAYTTGEIEINGIKYNPNKAIPKDVNNLPTIHIKVNKNGEYDKNDWEKAKKYYIFEEVV